MVRENPVRRAIGSRTMCARLLVGAFSALCAMSCWVVPSSAQADQKGVPFYAHSLKWWEQHSFWRLGYGAVIYTGGSSNASFTNPQGLASLGVRQGPIPNSGGGLQHLKWTPAGELGIILPWFDDHVSLEVAIAPPLHVKFTALGNLATQPIASFALLNQPGTPSGDPLPTGVPAIGNVIGTLHALPPNFTIVYRPWLHTFIRPYVGIGMVWLFTYGMHITAPVLHYKVDPPQLVLKRPIGCVAQAGFDIRLPWDFFLTADARYLGCATVHAELQRIKVYSPSVSPTFGPVNAGTVALDAKFRAFLVQLSIGSTFWGGTR